MQANSGDPDQTYGDRRTSCRLKTLCLFYFVLDSEKIVIMSGL